MVGDSSVRFPQYIFYTQSNILALRAVYPEYKWESYNLRRPSHFYNKKEENEMLSNTYISTLQRSFNGQPSFGLNDILSHHAKSASRDIDLITTTLGASKERTPESRASTYIYY
jgi:hypothetical protein